MLRVEVAHRLGELELEVALEVGRRPVALIGPNGAGKSSLLKLLCGGMRADRARIVCGDEVWQESAAKIWSAPHLRRVGYVPQGPSLFPHLNVLENVAFGAPGTAKDARRRAGVWLECFEASDWAGRRPHELSGGQAQRVVLARALASEPRVLLLDEPLSALDAITRRRLRRRLAEVLSEHAIHTVMVTHDWRDVEAMGAQVVALEGGRVVQRGSLEALRQAPQTAFVAEFTGV
ncbi:ABC transporter ATP-binding protein [Lujinxingia litoralis]|uniref:ABC transporter ATP-binding protein n=1 Tax=Lujinxingia litoralis TaxID=2211119 RepID=A0A328CDP4_9DELT|nr:ATP-binding cassette domain-containing protein [Lujinxingia litoralis]RAL25119.1 ABC transporter ATP-binding protein [Lujinxingia litoralis]